MPASVSFSARRFLLLILCIQSPALAGWAVVCNDGDAPLKDVPAGLSRGVAAARDKKQDIKCIALTPGGGWIVLTGKNGYVARGVPGKAFDALAKLAKQGADLKSITFGPAGSWVILFDKSRFEAGGVGQDLSAKLDDLSKSGADLKCVALAPAGGWAVLSNRNHFDVHDIPAEAVDRLSQFEKKNADLTAMAFTPTGGWAILTDQNGVFCRNVPDDAYKKLLELGRQKTAVRCIAFSTDLLHFTQDDNATREQVLRRLAYYKVPAMSVAVVDGNKIAFAHGYGVVETGGAAVNDQTRFQAGSVSKPVASLGALRLVGQGKLSLDEDLNRYLASWKIKQNQFTADKSVTLREVLSHTAGFNVHGFGGYAADHRLPTLAEVLNGAPPANSPAVLVETVPGTKYAYSGGGITVMQQAVIDVTHQPFEKVMQDQVLGPLLMKQSTYEQPLPQEWRGLAATGHENGKPLAGKWHVYPEKAAAGLWTTPSDLARFVIALAQAGRDEPGAILPPDLAKQMLTKQTGGWGLGIAVDGTGQNLRFSHDGVNAGFLTQMIGYVHRGQGVVVMVNSGGDEATALMAEVCQDVGIELGWE